MIKMTGELTIFRKDFDGRAVYSYSISRKEQDGTYKNMFKPIQFKKDVQIENKTKIQLVNAWQTFYTGKNGDTDFVFCSEFELLDAPQTSGFTAIEDDSDFMPF